MNEWSVHVRNTRTGRGTKIKVDAETVPEALGRALLTALLPDADDAEPRERRPACLECGQPEGECVYPCDNAPDPSMMGPSL